MFSAPCQPSYLSNFSLFFLSLAQAREDSDICKINFVTIDCFKFFLDWPWPVHHKTILGLPKLFALKMIIME